MKCFVIPTLKTTQKCLANKNDFLMIARISSAVINQRDLISVSLTKLWVWDFFYFTAWFFAEDIWYATL